MNKMRLLPFYALVIVAICVFLLFKNNYFTVGDYDKDGIVNDVDYRMLSFYVEQRQKGFIMVVPDMFFSYRMDLNHDLSVNDEDLLILNQEVNNGELTNNQN